MESFQDLHDSISASLVSTVRTASRISAEDIGFLRTSRPAVSSSLDKQNARLVSLAERLLRCSSAGTPRIRLSDAEGVEGNWRSIVDVIDGLLERVDSCLDEFNGLVKRMSPNERAQSPATKVRPRRNLAYAYRDQDIPKPQTSFAVAPSNFDSQPFQPFLTIKPHALKSLDDSRVMFTDENGLDQYQHPYQHEIDAYQYPAAVYMSAKPIPYHPFEETTATFVDDFIGVEKMLEELKQATEIAIDLEHHDTHSYVGIVSLMQISTRKKDWIVDTIKPWRRKLEILNEVFTDPKIVKVLHGAHMDAIWLQRDLGIYLVGLFDTHHASRVLSYSGGSLAFLLKKFINFDAQKQYQTADWRIRPLPHEMFDYARSDTHFLLYIYDNMRNELIARSNFEKEGGDLLQDVLQRSKETALQRFEQHTYDVQGGPGRLGWSWLLFKNPMRLSEKQLNVFRKVHQWRDLLARGEDESLNHVMPNHVLFSITSVVPKDATPLLSVLHPISPFVRARLNELMDLIRSAEAEIPESSGTLGGETPRPQSVVVEADATALGGLRAGRSQFWGVMLDTTMKPTQSHAPLDSYVLPGPLLLAREVANDAAPAMPAWPVRDDHAAASTYATQESASEPGQKRAREDDLNGQAPAGSEDQVETFEERAQKIRRKAERKAAKARRKSSEPQALQSEHNEATTPGRSAAVDAFDYNTAPPVLNAAATKPDYKHKKTSFNPYAKAAEGPAGVKRAQSTVLGKSGTFKA